MNKLEHLTKALNTAIASDSLAVAALEDLSGMVVLFEIEDFAKSFYLQFLATEVIVYDEFNEEIDLTIKGRFMALLGMSPISKYAVPGSWPKSIEIQGDLTYADQLRSWLAIVHIDWAALLSPYLGDSLASSIISGANFVGNKALNVGSRLKQHSKDWVQNENSLGVCAADMTAFLDDVDQIKSQADRLSARITFLEEQEK